ncbi:hypothetical protein D1007_15763 [Hordeum vulgare]|uniref:Predicted protein n=1 Tax=Hordeum vulgare subsp. vulgare TaxID=112509 RepID=F2E2W3_HORVV|nr:uncharacterized protein LOC123440299 [Hordeum vulgare subsp. vulgare]KAE8807938.1 hypothetical protein D1007_15763 [Hordeum vulgare]KAI5000576.1 hypothetical protein ZWY2020_005165 [Hordeum vulgare]BAK01685.1 predicted protein [Hordeum vulgare subsp. vulgare]
MTKDGSGQTGGCLCIGAPMRALSRACDSACDLYVRGMSGCAIRVPAGAVAGGRGSGFVRSATTVHLWTSSDRADDLIRAVSTKQRRVATADQPADVGAAKKGRLSEAAPAIVPARRKGPAMATIAENGPCDFGACALRPTELRKRAPAVGGQGARAGGFVAVMEGREAFVARS